MGAEQVYGLAAGVLSAAVFGLAAVAQARGVRRTGSSPDRLTSFVARSVRDPWTLGVVAAYLVGFVLHAVAIWYLPLYLAQATIALSLPVTAVASRRLSERLSATQWSAVGLVTAGLVLLALGSGQPGPVVTSTVFVACVWGAFGLLALVALVSGSLPSGGLGAVAGLGYATSAIAVRGVGTPVDGAVVVAALAVPSLSVIAFWLYSRAMHDGRVAAASAPLIVVQTFVPAAVGVLLLGDGVRSGWAWAVAVGLVLASAGAVLLARDPATAPAPAAAGR